jgi:hypothetical protein
LGYEEAEVKDTEHGYIQYYMVNNKDGTVDFLFREADNADAAAAGKPDKDDPEVLARKHWLHSLDLVRGTTVSLPRKMGLMTLLTVTFVATKLVISTCVPTRTPPRRC